MHASFEPRGEPPPVLPLLQWRRAGVYVYGGGDGGEGTAAAEAAVKARLGGEGSNLMLCAPGLKENREADYRRLPDAPEVERQPPARPGTLPAALQKAHPGCARYVFIARHYRQLSRRACQWLSLEREGDGGLRTITTLGMFWVYRDIIDWRR